MKGSTYPFASLPENLAAFCALLRSEYRFRIGPGEMQDAARALGIVELGNERAVRDVLRPVLAGRFEEAQVFDRAFDRFFHGSSDVRPELPARTVPAGDESPPRDTEVRTLGQTGGADRRPGMPDVMDDMPGGGSGAVHEVADAELQQPAALIRTSYSPLESEGAVPDLEPPDREWRAAAAALVHRVRARLSRRWHPARHGQRFDFRRTLRGSLHTGGDVVTPRWRARRRREPRFVVLVDGSRSMEADARPPLQMAVALTSVSPDTETFTFSTELRRVTLDARRAAAGEPRPLHLRRAWGGGTTIGVCLDEFLRRFGDRALRRQTVVIIASDGLDVGHPDLLRRSMETLARHAAAIIWLNPLAATAGYEPTARGMRLARPFVALLAPANDPAGLLKIAHALRIR
jgi:uncharacterized protein with von Willebrand factor type A (vWA) domain